MVRCSWDSNKKHLIQVLKHCVMLLKSMVTIQYFILLFVRSFVCLLLVTYLTLILVFLEAILELHSNSHTQR